MLRMMVTGFVGHWKDIYLPKPIQCMTDLNSRQAMLADLRNPALVNLHGLVLAFLFLSFGFIIVLMVLFTEWIIKLKFWKLLLHFGSPRSN